MANEKSPVAFGVRRATIDKFDGDRKPGDLPVEVIRAEYAHPLDEKPQHVTVLRGAEAARDYLERQYATD